MCTHYDKFLRVIFLRIYNKKYFLSLRIAYQVNVDLVYRILLIKNNNKDENLKKLKIFSIN